ncbi:MAG: DUF2339 domain-containing protein [Burkholderiales bacterium]|nr:DUF2339 domain-containing protein [Burkholderiales bacterium]
MWFIGLIAGALLGAAWSGDLALAGAGVGAIAGALYRGRGAGAAEIVRLEKIEDAIRQLSRRLKALEAQAQPARTDGESASAAAPADAAAAEPSAAGETTTAAPEPPAAAATSAAAGTAEGVSPAPAAQPFRPFAEEAAREADPGWWDRLIGGNLVAKAGVVILFFGVGFLLKYAYDNALLPVPLRLAGVALAGAALFATGWRLLATRRLYGLILQGGGIGLLYLDVFFALKVYALIAPQWGFALFMALGVLTTLLAVRQDAGVLAVLGLSGAFMAPVLAGSDSGSHVLLFSYYLLLNALILAVSWFKSWRALNLVGFFFTFLVGLFWGWRNYRPELFASVEPFVVAFFLMYLAIPVLFAHRQPPRLRGLVDASLVFGTPLTAAAMQAGLVRDMPYGLAWSAGCAAAVYALLALLLWRREGMRVLAEAHAALAVVLASLTVAFAFDAYPTFALWTLEGAALVWIGLRQERLAMRLFGLLLQAGGAVLFLAAYDSYDLANPWFNDFVAGCVLVAVASLLTSGLMHRKRGILIRGGEATAALLLAWGVLWWFAGGLHALRDGLTQGAWATAALLFTAASIAAAELAGVLARWPAIRRTHLLLPAAMAIVLLDQYDDRLHPFADHGWLAWPVAVLVFYGVLARQERDGIAMWPPLQHVVALWGVTFLAAWELAWQLESRLAGGDWSIAAWGAVPALVLGGISYRGFGGGWPFAAHARSYRGIGLGMLAAWCAAWTLIALGHAARLAPMPYFPLLNALDFAHVAALLAIGLWLSVRAEAGEASSRGAPALLGGLAFLVLNTVVLRAVHHWAGVRYTVDAMLHSVLAQAALSLVWTATALLLMIWARRAGLRGAWFGGAALLAAVVGKLFMLDLANAGTVERIVTFIGVGLGLLAIGYFAPVPPGSRESEGEGARDAAARRTVG